MDKDTQARAERARSVFSILVYRYFMRAARVIRVARGEY